MSRKILSKSKYRRLVRRQQRRRDNDELAKAARFWRKPADRDLLHDKPVNRDAAKLLHRGG